MSGFLEKCNEVGGKFSGLLALLQFLTPAALIAVAFVGNLYLDKRLSNYTTIEETRAIKVQWDNQFTEINHKLNAILGNQSVVNEQMKTVNQILSTQNSQILRLDDRILYIERENRKRYEQ
jgi:hypothetical protein